jgi:hypothetical protein
LIKLISGQEADDIEQLARAGLEAVKPPGDKFAQLFEVIAERMAVQHILTQPTPEFFDRIKPRGVGWQKE